MSAWQWLAESATCVDVCGCASSSVEDVVWRRPEIMFDSVDMQAMPGSAPDDQGTGAGSQKPARVRLEFPETWLWADAVAR